MWPEDLATVSKDESSMRDSISDIPDRGGVFLPFLPIAGSILEVSSASVSSRSGGKNDGGSWGSKVRYLQTLQQLLLPYCCPYG